MIGRGTTVGRPLGLLLTRKSENSTVTLCHTGTVDLARHTREADIVVAAAGRPGLFTADMIKAGAVCVDVGITRTDVGSSVILIEAFTTWRHGSHRCPAESVR